jgi:hypothetical protein
VFNQLEEDLVSPNLGATFSPTAYNTAQPPSTITVTGTGFSSTYGQPIVQFYDEAGQFYWEATTVGSTSTTVTVDTPTLAAGSNGAYVGYEGIVLNENASGDYYGVGTAILHVYYSSGTHCACQTCPCQLTKNNERDHPFTVIVSPCPLPLSLELVPGAPTLVYWKPCAVNSSMSAAAVEKPVERVEPERAPRGQATSTIQASGVALHITAMKSRHGDASTQIFFTRTRVNCRNPAAVAKPAAAAKE